MDELLSKVKEEYTCHGSYPGSDDLPKEVAEFLELLRAEVLSLKAAMQLVGQRSGVDPVMSRADALKLAREHVESMSTNARGYQDGVSLANKVSAVDTFARFLLGEESE